MRLVTLAFVVTLIPVQPTTSPGVVATDVAEEAGIYEVTASWSLAAADYDGDGLKDFLLVRHLDYARLFRNEGGGRFAEAGTFRQSDRHDCDWADVDQDGLMDVYCSVGAEHGTSVKANELWIQQPDHTFVDMATEFGAADPYGRGRRLTFIDVNHDAYPDLFVGNLFPRQDQHPSPNRLLINRGGTRFREAPRFGLTREIGAGCAQAADYDGDGWEDLLVCGVTRLRLFRNEDGGSFADVSASMGIPGGNTRSALLHDLDGDGRLDLVLTQAHTVSVRLQGARGFRAPSFSITLRAGARISVGDVNADGRPDLYLVTGCGAAGRNAPDATLVNRGGARFDRVTIPQTLDGCGDVALPIDHDGNGTTDFVVMNGRGFVDGEPVAGPVQLISFGP